ncbi:TPA: hypothetical protein RNS99_000487 [Stenotrophomonas maltophilia]|uniref:hypothetical protein n=1 Tax=Stenotrophomonas maltophilia TaxID=40324 RepID=UPI00066D0362|nr:hypothetical protein [Stenotrophomonas maltophilia]HDX0898609.1 hypothetical protein [Stenotrophomonas maltophilia]HDX0916276.1 hypothetical protein [Stenotrophomonas maltophilia]HEL3010202.1 hypothetical protein [Stenotrophomonas maltophilia]HEL4138092.1 hypothetical protein [Stenotrophomonas maltophilia]
MKKNSLCLLLTCALGLTTPLAAQENPLQPVWERASKERESPAPYTGKYCDYSQFSGLEFTFSRDEVYRKYGFQHFSKTVDGFESLPFDEYAGKRGKIGREAGADAREVLVEDCSSAYLRNAREIDAEDAMAFGIEFAVAPATTWVVTSETDRMTDAKSCHVTPQTDRLPYPMFFYHSKEGLSVAVVGGDFPGKSTRFRVDKNRAVSEVDGLSGQRAQALVAQIRSGGRLLLVGAYQWPYESEVIREFNLSGLVEKLNTCKSAVSR